MEALSSQNVPVIAADMPFDEDSSLDTSFEFSMAQQIHIALTQRCNDIKNADAPELPPPHRFVRSPSTKNQGFKSKKQVNRQDLPYLASYRQIQGRLMASDAPVARPVTQDEVFRLADEILRSYRIQ